MSIETHETRVKILDAALHLLQSDNPGATRMADIARQAGISRQAVYLHYKTRAELLIAATLHLDHISNTEQRLEASRSANTGLERLDRYIDAWGNYIPVIYPVATALMAMQKTDTAAASAWNDRMQAMRHGCAAAVKALSDDKQLTPHYTNRQATDLLWTLLSVSNWEQLTLLCKWSQKTYISHIKSVARNTLVV